MQRKPRKLAPTGPSIADVAKRAGVSSQTVSRVSTGAQPVRPETRQRVLAAMEELGYFPNQAAQALKNGTFRTLGVLTQQIERTGEIRTTAGVIDAAQQAGYAITILQSHAFHTQEGRTLVRRLSQQAIDGLIVVQAGMTTEEQLALPPHLPVAVSDRTLSHRFPLVNADQKQGIHHALEHLIRLGHTNIAHISGPTGSYSAELRKNEWHTILTQHNLPAHHLYNGDWTAESGYKAGQKITQNPDITAVFCANDETAFGLMRACHEAGLSIPTDISIIGFDGIELGEYTPTPLATVKINFHHAGQRMVELVTQQIRAGHIDTAYEELIPCEFLPRHSTAPKQHRRMPTR